MALATRPGFKNLTADTTVTNWNAPLNRMNAATIIANMIMRSTVSYNLQAGVGGNVTSMVVENKENGEAISFAQAYLKMDKKTGTLVANEFGSIESVTAINTLKRDYKGENAVVKLEDGNKELKLASAADQLGNKVTAYYKNNRFIYAAVAETAEVEPAFFMGTLTNHDTDGIKLYVNGAITDSGVADDADTADVDESVITNANLAAAMNTAGLGGLNNAKNAFNVKYDAEISYRDTDGDGYIDTIIAYTFSNPTKIASTADSEKYGKVLMTGSTAWNEKRFEATTSNAVQTTAIIESLRDFDAEKGEYVMTTATAIKNCFGKDFNHGVTLETIEAKVTRKTSDDKTIYLDGTKYANDAKTEEDALVSLTVGDEGKFYVLGSTIVVTDLESKETSNTYALIYDAGFERVGTTTTIGGSAKYVFEVAAALPDGTSKVFEVGNFYVDGKKVTDMSTIVNTDGDGFEQATLASVKNAAADDGTANVLMAYTLTDGKINLFLDKTAVTTAGDDKNASEITTETKVANGSAKVGNFLLTKDSVTYVRTSEKSATTEEKWVVYTGTTAPTYTIVANGAVAMHNDANNISYMAVSETKPTDNTTKGIFYLLENPTVIDKDGKLQVTAFSSADKKPVTLEYTVDEEKSGCAGEAGHIYQAWTDTIGFTTELEADTDNAGFITRADSNVLVLNMLKALAVPADPEVAGDKGTPAELYTNVFTTNNDTVVISINGEDTEIIRVGDIDVQSTVADVRAGETLKGYQTIVVEGTGDDVGIAKIVVILADATKID